MTAPYVTGTVSVTAGSAVVTGSGTAWATALIVGGLFGLDSNNGNPVPILSVDSDTQLTLAKAWRGTTSANQAYWIIRDTAYLQQQTANAQALSTYIQRLDNAVLAALAGLTPAADKFAYFNGASTAVLTDLKAKGRDIIAAVDTLGLLEKLGPVLGGPAPVPSAAGVGLSDGDFNTIVVEGVYTIAGTWSNSPTGTTAQTAVLEVKGRAFDNLCVQTLSYNTGSGLLVWRRRSVDNGATWDAWAVIESPTVGIVTQSGGVPAGAIIERGSNANGEYVKFADGTMICTSPEVTVSMNQATGNLFYSNAVSLPMPVLFTGVQPVGFGHAASTINAWVNARTAFGSWVGAAYSAASRASDTIRFGAIGRWF
ncbi:phage tail protein [Sinorhizobium medicae]|nr:phage tail protein [Sinorhizobium medicae]